MDRQTLLDTALKFYDKQHELDVFYFDLWKTSILFTWRWWVAASLVILPWTLWAIVRKRESTHRLLYVGVIIALLSTFLDMTGIVFHQWSYPITVFPITPSYIPFDVCALPVATMLWLQFFPKWNLILKTFIYSAGGTLFDFFAILSA